MLTPHYFMPGHVSYVTNQEVNYRSDANIVNLLLTNVYNLSASERVHLCVKVTETEKLFGHYFYR